MALIKRLWPLLVCLLLCSCTLSDIPASTTEQNISEETESTEETGKRFASAFEARRACLNALDYIHNIKHYDPDALEAYKDWANDMRIRFSDDTLTIADYEEMYPQMIKAQGSLALAQGDVARVYITTGSGSIGNSYTSCQLGFVPAAGEEGEQVTYIGCEIKLRGNSTLEAPKKPYTFKLPYNDSLFGMDEGKRWVLLAEMYDKSLMRGYLGLTLAQELGCPYSSQTKMTEVYLNGHYQGVYQLVEPITDGKEGVDIDVEENEFLLEVDVIREDQREYLITPRYNTRFKIDKPEQVSNAKLTWLKNFLTEAETSLLEDSDRYKDYFDTESFINVYLTLEYTKNLDSNNFSTRYYIKDNKIYAGPVWDFDLSAGNASDVVEEEGYRIYLNILGKGDNSEDSTRGIWNQKGWFHGLFGHAEFAQAVADRFFEIRPILENFFMENQLGPSRIDTLQALYGDAYRRNYDDTDWDVYTRYGTYEMEPGMSYDEHVAWLTSWYRDRLDWLTEYFQPYAQPREIP